MSGGGVGVDWIRFVPIGCIAGRVRLRLCMDRNFRQRLQSRQKKKKLLSPIQSMEVNNIFCRVKPAVESYFFSSALVKTDEN
jgi:uncharacterized lipoprotein YddW (UPF0748 family)